MKVGLVIPIYNRPQYVKQCFDSLRKLITKPDVIVLVDDASTDSSIWPMLNEFSESIGCGVVIGHKQNGGVKKALLTGIDSAFQNGANLVINLDSDAIVKPDFIVRLVYLHDMGIENRIVSGFNTHNDKNPILLESKECEYVEKDLCNGINMCFNRAMYEAYIRPSLLKDGNWDYNTSLLHKKRGLSFLISAPSVVQHIGLQSSMGHVGADVAHDFKQLSLPNITLFGIDSHDKAGIERAAQISQRSIEFGAVKIITDDLFTKGGSNEVRRRDYSRFMMKELAEHVTTSHVLTIHADGYILNPLAWDNAWLEFDFIGATWSYKDGMNNGNGGFSLRSKKLCDILAAQNINDQYIHPEDFHIGRTFRPSLEKDFGIKFAPEEVCNKFSIEAYGAQVFPGGNLYSGQFGFHSVHVDFSRHLEYGVPKDILYNKRPQPFHPIRNKFARSR